MAVSVYYGRLTIPTSSGSQDVTGIVDIDGSTAFTPKAVLFWTSFVPSGTAFTDQGYWCVGMTDGTRQACRSFFANKDNLSPTTEARGFTAEAYSESKCIWIRKYSSGTPPSAVVFTNIAASITAFASGQFTLTWSAVDSTQALVHFLAFGGADLTARCDVFEAPSTAGAQTQTVTGVGFEASGLVTIAPMTTLTERTSTGLGLDGSRMSGFGFVSNALVNLYTGGFSLSAPPSVTTYRAMWRDAAWAERKMQTSTGNPIGISGTVNTISSDGFTVNWAVLDATFVGVRVPYLAFHGMPTYVGRFFQPLAPAAGSVVSSGLIAALFAGSGFPASTSLNENPLPQPLRLCLGGLTARASSNQGCAFIGDATGVSTTVSVRGLDETHCYISATPAATGSSTAIYAEAEGDMATGIALDWTEANASQNEVFLMLFGDPTAPTPEPEPPDPQFPPVPPPVPEGTVRPIRRLRRFALPFEMNVYVFLSRLEVLIQSGVGLNSGQGSDPILMLRLSRDGGQTWGSEIQMGMGAQGQYDYRAYVNRLGRGRNWVAELTVTDPVFSALLACYVDTEIGNS